MPKARTVNPDPEYVASILEYNPTTGELTWKIARHYGTQPPGSRATNDKVKILGGFYRSHRVAWCLAYGEWPDGTIFWKNGIKYDNRLNNLGLTPFAPKELDADYLRKILHYDPDTGEFFWLINERLAKHGELAGFIMQDTGRRMIGVGGEVHLSSRLAWLYVYGRWPDGNVDHWSGDVTDDSIDNLRDASDSQNNANRKHPKSNTGYSGIQKNCNKFHVTCNHKYLGLYTTLEEAVAVRKKAEEEMQGEFAYAQRKSALGSLRQQPSLFVSTWKAVAFDK